MNPFAAKTNGSRILAIGLLTMVLGVSTGALMLPFLDNVAATQKELAREHRDLSKLKDSLSTLKAQNVALSSEEFSAFGWTGSQLGQVGAMIQARLSKVAQAHNIRLRSANTIPSAPLAEMQTLGLMLEAEAPLDRVVAYLHEIEGFTPVIIIKRLNIRRLNRPGQALVQPMVHVRIELNAPLVITERGEDG